ncbi:MAG: hypothetical protein R3C59_22950 [Planctomycetaceae bacterium]
MTDSMTDFEDQLRQLKPTSLDERLPETFYRAGWQACEQTGLARLRKAPRGRWIPAFSGGLLCGLLVSVGVAAWTQSSHDSEQGQRIVARDSHDSESATVHNDQASGSHEAFNQVDAVAATNETIAPAIDWKSLTENFSPWADANASAFEDTVPAAARPLSVAARRHWSCLVEAADAVSHTGTEVWNSGPATAERETPLRTFPATEERLRELL